MDDGSAIWVKRQAEREVGDSRFSILQCFTTLIPKGYAIYIGSLVRAIE